MLLQSRSTLPRMGSASAVHKNCLFSLRWSKYVSMAFCSLPVRESLRQHSAPCMDAENPARAPVRYHLDLVRALPSQRHPSAPAPLGAPSYAVVAGGICSMHRSSPPRQFAGPWNGRRGITERFTLRDVPLKTFSAAIPPSCEPTGVRHLASGI